MQDPIDCPLLHSTATPDHTNIRGRHHGATTSFQVKRLTRKQKRQVLHQSLVKVPRLVEGRKRLTEDRVRYPRIHILDRFVLVTLEMSCFRRL